MLSQRHESAFSPSGLKKTRPVDCSTDFAFNSYGARIGIRGNDTDLMARVEELLPPGAKPSSPEEVDNRWSFYVASEEKTSRPCINYYSLYDNSLRRVNTSDSEKVLETFASSVHLSVAIHATPYLFVHAGVVAWKGQAIVLPGRSMTGKSTLVATLVRAGATYYSDEYAVFDEAGRVHPYPRPLSLRDEEGNGRKRIPAESLGGRVGTRPLPVGLVAVAPYEAGASWNPQSLTSGQAVLTLLDNTVMARSRAQDALYMLQQSARDTVALKGARGEAEKIVPHLLNR